MDGAAEHIFYMDFGFLRALLSDYTQPLTKTDRVVASFDGFEAYFLIVDEATRHVWVFLTKSKDPPLDTAVDFLKRSDLAERGPHQMRPGRQVGAVELVPHDDATRSWLHD